MTFVDIPDKGANPYAEEIEVPPEEGSELKKTIVQEGIEYDGFVDFEAQLGMQEGNSVAERRPQDSLAFDAEQGAGMMNHSYDGVDREAEAGSMSIKEKM